MNERTIFLEALDKPTLADKAAFLDSACRDDPRLRARVEALLQSHHNPGEFLEKSAMERVAEKLATLDEGGETEGVAAPSPIDERLDFLTPSQLPGSLGRIGHYEVQEVVGRGGMGIVLRALDERLHRVVAIKVMAPQLATSAAARKRFSKEAQAAAAICHDHIVTIHAVDEANGLPYLAMQYVAGLSLQERINRSGSLQLQEILRIGMQAASGLAAAHSQGLIHRDVKPANILLENGVERVKITDFGLARAADDSSTSQSGMIAGTPQYMSPEQARGAAIDRRADLFSLGSVLYAMCTGRSPFRGANSIAVLKRVCEDTPAPIRDCNPEVPDWLVAIIEKLQAKDPAERFQSATEVADLLGRHLAHVQHPSVISLPQAVAVTAESESPRRIDLRSRPATSPGTWWPAAAVLLVLLCGGLSLTEATGVTRVVPTVIRIVTGEGTLVVETDPNVQVTMAGNGDLTFQLAGGQSIRVPAGDYRVKATKEGKPIPLDKELVSIARGRNQVVHVRLERAPQIAAAPQTEQGAFALVAAGTGVAERKFNTLAEAVQGASDGDTIEIRGNGPFVTDHIEFRHTLAVRAGAGFRPVLATVLRNEFPWGTQLVSYAPLRLEGLEIHGTSHAQGPLWVANCRFLVADNMGTCIESRAGCVIQNCEVVSAGAALGFQCDSEATSVVTNNLLIGHMNLWEHDLTRGATFQFTGNTLVSAACNAFLHGATNQPVRTTDPLEERVHLSLANNVITCGSGPYGFGQLDTVQPQLSGKEAELWVQRRLDWRDENNSYQVERGQWIQIRSDGVVLTTSHKTLADWNSFWGLKTTGSSEDVIRFLGGNLVSRALTQLPKLTPEDFRLRADSAGYRAGPDGKDVGADVDLVGPGAAYERWQKTPEYEEWLRETGQRK